MTGQFAKGAKNIDQTSSPLETFENGKVKKAIAYAKLALLFGLALLFSLYLPINNIAEYWNDKIQYPVMELFIFFFAGAAFHLIFSDSLIKKCSKLGRKLYWISVAGWSINHFLICIDSYLNRTGEVYIIGCMIIAGPSAVVLFDRLKLNIWRKIQQQKRVFPPR